MSKFNDSTKLICPKELTKDRFVKPSGLSKKQAKKIALKNGVIWRCD